MTRMVYAAIGVGCYVLMGFGISSLTGVASWWFWSILTFSLSVAVTAIRESAARGI